jgi:SAM-dependent methyltransferase
MGQAECGIAAAARDETACHPAPGRSDEERLRHGRSFGPAAAAYAEHRPGYPAAAVAWALQPVAARRPLRIIDLGAGTGKLTGTLAAQPGAEVTAVEPDAAMRAELRRRFPAIAAPAGRAESIPLPDRCADAVLCGQALHWFDLEAAMPEIARVLTPGGVLAGLWNYDDDRVGWVAGLAGAVGVPGSLTRSQWQAGRNDVLTGWLGAGGRDGFGPPERAEFPNRQWRTARTLVATLGTHSAFLVMEPAERAAALARARDYLDSRPETRDGQFLLPMVTGVVRAMLAPGDDPPDNPPHSHPLGPGTASRLAGPGGRPPG